jgi:hypothetical protein
VAQLVEHHLAKVRVAGSNPVVRSERVSPSPYGEKCFLVEWPRGEATDCKSVYTGSNPVSTSGDWPGQRHFPAAPLIGRPHGLLTICYSCAPNRP